MISEFWELRRIDSLGRIITGKTPSSKNPEHFDGPFPFITIPDLEHKLFMDETERSISNAGAEKLNNSVIPKNSVCVSCIATIGRVGLTTKPSITNQQINSIVCNDDVDPVFLYYAMCHFSHALKFFTGGGAVVPNISKSLFGKMEIFLPPFVEQKSIGEKLLLLDKLIEKNKRISEVGSEFIQTLFRSWFIDFDPVKAKAEGALPYRMDDETVALFPDSFEDSELGPIPTGWRVFSISEICKMSSGGTPSRTKEEYFTKQGVGYPWLASRELNGNIIHDAEEYISELGLKNSSAKLFSENSVAMAMYGATAGRIGYFAKPLTTSQAICVMMAKENICLPKYLYFLIESESWKIVWMNALGGAQPNISQQSIGKHLIVLPSFEIIQKFESLVDELFANNDTSSIQSEKLSEIRDALLPRLMSGDLKVN